MLKQYSGGNLGGNLWFRDDFFDLEIQVGGNGDVQAFKLSYDWQSVDPLFIRWSTKGGAEHFGLDMGEGRPLKPKASPMVVCSGIAPRPELPELFRERSSAVPEQIASMLYQTLSQAVRC